MQAQQQRAGLQRQLTEMQKAQLTFTQQQHALSTEQQRLEREVQQYADALKQTQVCAQPCRKRFVAALLL
jgi:predicted  nucleic acid-binding Zn-ribbon protein